MSERAIDEQGVAALGHDELLRYSRQINLAQVGEEGQCRLQSKRGCSVLALAASGRPRPLSLLPLASETIGIIDQDTVDLSNLHRQILHGTSGCRKRKD